MTVGIPSGTGRSDFPFHRRTVTARGGGSGEKASRIQLVVAERHAGRDSGS
jgi:hypothetical protein